MLLKNLRVSGLLSFGPNGVDLPLRPLNVLVGPNGSGKSNVLSILDVLRAAPTNVATPMNETGGIQEWRWKGRDGLAEGRIDATVAWDPPDAPDFSIRHYMEFGTIAERPYLFDEFVDAGVEREDNRPRRLFGYAGETFQLVDYGGRIREIAPGTLDPTQSVLSQIKDPVQYPAIAWLQHGYGSIALFRDWAFGPHAALRDAQSTHGRDDYLSEGGGNLAVVLSNFDAGNRQELVRALTQLYDGIVELRFSIRGGRVLLFLVEQGGREIPATRLSDGTLRYLCLLAILLHPNPPRLIAIEEPELGLHPDVIPVIAKLLVEASERTQLIVTTHSRMLIDALGDDPARVVVCERLDGESQFRRLDADALRVWLEKYSLGDLWSMGELGGNRW